MRHHTNYNKISLLICDGFPIPSTRYDQKILSLDPYRQTNFVDLNYSLFSKHETMKYLHFSNSLMIHQAKTKQITTVKKV